MYGNAQIRARRPVCPALRACLPAALLPALLADCIFRTEPIPFRVDEVPGAAGIHDYRVFWGDVHTHSALSLDHSETNMVDACGPRSLFHNAKAVGLDFVAITDHLEDFTEQGWRETLEAAVNNDHPGLFVPFVGYEYCDSAGSIVSCTNVIFPTLQGGPVYAGSSMRRPGLTSLAEFVVGESELWKHLASLRARPLGIVAHPPSQQSWSFPTFKREVVHGAEIGSTGGGPAKWEYRMYQSTILAGIGTGLDLQVFGSSNDHHSRPGRASLTAVLARDLSRASLFEAILAMPRTAPRRKEGHPAFGGGLPPRRGPGGHLHLPPLRIRARG